MEWLASTVAKYALCGIICGLETGNEPSVKYLTFFPLPGGGDGPRHRWRVRPAAENSTDFLSEGPV